jgi:hypothetical protein
MGKSKRRAWTSSPSKTERSVARFDDLNWESPQVDFPRAEADRRPKWLRRWLPMVLNSSRPLSGEEMAKIKMVAYH